jgi:hypothetical protein
MPLQKCNPIFLHTTQKCSNELSKTLNEPKTLGDRCRYITDISTVKKTQFWNNFSMIHRFPYIFGYVEDIWSLLALFPLLKLCLSLITYIHCYWNSNLLDHCDSKCGTLPLISDPKSLLLPHRPSLFGFQELDPKWPHGSFWRQN